MSESSNAAAGPTGLDWDDWGTTLTRFAAATGLCVCAYDEDGKRQVGPLASARVARLLSASGIWDEGRPGAQIEHELAARVRASGRIEQTSVCDELRVQAVPVCIDGRVRASIVYGWAPRTFGTPQGCEQIARRLGVDGARLWAEVRLQSPVPDERMRVYTELLETMVESTARHAEALGRLQELGRMREVFLAGVSHELRTPLSVLGTRIELLLRGTLGDPESVRTSLLNMKHHVAIEARLVEDLIEAARTRTGQLRLDKQPSSLRNILQEAIAAIQPIAEGKQIPVRVPEDLSDLGEMPLFADAHRLQQVFWNLLSNAVKFTPAAGRIEVSVLRTGQDYRVTVADSGSGIEEALLPHVFDPFTKQHKANAQGLGLGLSIARHIVEQHGGAIGVESAGRNAGATFHVTLPALRA